VLLTGVAVFWGTNWVAIKVSVAEIPIWQYRVTTSIFAGIVMLAMARVGGHSLRVPRFIWGRFALAALFNITGWQVLSAYGAHMIASGKAAILAYTMPIWTTLLAVIFLRERLTWRILAALALSAFGVLVLISSSLETFGDSPLGILLAVLAAFSWAAGTVVQKSIRWPMPVIVMAGWQIFLGGIPILIVALLAEPIVIQNASAPALLSLAYSLMVPMLFGQYAWFKVVSLFPASIAAIGTVMVPMVGMLSGAAILGEPLGWREIVALLSVIAAIALVVFQRRAPPPAAREH
jgi:drug/metabolite transporter (DMT)-like permease